MDKIVDRNLCCGCHACYNICPKNAIEMQADEKGFLHPVINQDKCINCGKCKKACPVLNKLENSNRPVAYAAYNKDYNVRKQSSSGGIFSLLANYIIECGGVVFGAAFDNNFFVNHIKIEEKCEIEKLRSSKYVQSNIGNVYKECKEILETGKIVLFTGTPCQINGLYTYLNKQYENLYTQDVICHGVPSPKVWEKYLEYRKNKDAGNNLINVNFRSKRKGWRLYELEFKYKNLIHRNEHNSDVYMRAFLRNISLRESCYNCFAKSKQRISDITLGDFWGINNISKKMNDDNGVSLVLINTKKGRELFEKINKNIVYEETDYDESIKYNKSLFESSVKSINSDMFFNGLSVNSFDDKFIIKSGIKDKIKHVLYLLKREK